MTLPLGADCAPHRAGRPCSLPSSLSVGSRSLRGGLPCGCSGRLRSADVGQAPAQRRRWPSAACGCTSCGRSCRCSASSSAPASVIALMAFGEGSMQDALDDIKRQGATNIIVRSVKPPDDSATAPAVVRRHLRADPATTTTGSTRSATSIIRMVPMRVFPSEVRYLERMVQRPRDRHHARVRRRQQARDGRRPVPDRRRRRARHGRTYCVLGSEAADKLFPFEDPLGQTVQIEQLDFYASSA